MTLTICYVTLSYENGDCKNNPAEICSFGNSIHCHFWQHPVMQQTGAASAIPLWSATAVRCDDAGRASKRRDKIGRPNLLLPSLTETRSNPIWKTLRLHTIHIRRFTSLLQWPFNYMNVHSIHFSKLKTVLIRQFHPPDPELDTPFQTRHITIAYSLSSWRCMRIYFWKKELERGVRFLERKDPCNTPNYASLI